MDGVKARLMLEAERELTGRLTEVIPILEIRIAQSVIRT